MPEPKLNREDYKKEIDENRSGEILEDLSGHLDELRNRIIIGILILLALFFAAFYYAGPIMKFLLSAAPQGSAFFQLKPGELFLTSLKVAFVAAFSVALPFLLQQASAFIKPGLKENEQKIIKPVIFLAPSLFYLGVFFAYKFVLPSLLQFLLGFKVGVVETRYGLEHFINLELSIILLCAIVFQLPVFLFILASLGLIKSSQLLSAWRYVILISFILAAVITPTPDPITMSVLALALIALYFFTYLILRLIKK